MIRNFLIISGSAFSCGILYSTTKQLITGKYKKNTINNFFNTGFIFGWFFGCIYTIIGEPIIPYIIKKYIKE